METQNEAEIQKLGELKQAEIDELMQKIEAAKTPAERVIIAFGGQSKAADALEISRAAVCLWNRETPRHGSQRGRIPSQQFDKILQAAKSRGIPLTAEHLARFDADETTDEAGD